jgi:hypothetical protein
MCEFVDDKASVFPFEELQRCMVDVMEEWEDFTPFADHPFGSRPVWIGYDPSHTGDSAGCVVLAPPVVSGGIRMLERHQWKGMDFAAQAEGIRKLTGKYNVEYIGRCDRPRSRRVPVGALILSGSPRHPLHTRNENRNGAQGERHDSSWLSGIRRRGKPENIGSLGDVEKVAKVFVRNELSPLQDISGR